MNPSRAGGMMMNDDDGWGWTLTERKEKRVEGAQGRPPPRQRKKEFRIRIVTALLSLFAGGG